MPIASHVDRVVRVLAAGNAQLGAAGRALAATALALMTLLVVGQVIGRAAFDYSPPWVEEACRFLLVWSAFAVAPLAYRSGAHISIELFQSALPRRLRLAVLLALHALALWICLVLLRESIAFVERGVAISATAIPMSMAWVYAIVPVSLGALVAVGIELILRLLRALSDPARPADVPGVDLPLVPPA